MDSDLSFCLFVKEIYLNILFWYYILYNLIVLFTETDTFPMWYIDTMSFIKA